MTLTADNDILLLLNPKCSKCREAKALLDARDVSYRERAYLDEPLSLGELQELRLALGQPVSSWIRSAEPAWREAGVNPGDDEQDVLVAIAKWPILMQRPIAVRGAKAIVGRPPEALLHLLDVEA